MKTIRKYQTGAALVTGGGGAAGGEAIMTVPGLAIPAALALAMYNTYKHPENTAMSRGMRAAEERWRAAQAQLEAEERAQVRAAAIAHNKQLAEYYTRELSKGPIVRNYTNGATTTITGYDPNAGRVTTTINDPNKGWTFEGTAPELNYNYLNGVNLEDELNGVVTTKYGTFTPEIDYVDWNTLRVKPGTLIEGLPGIATSQPIGLNPSIKINPRAMVLSTGQPVALPTDITDYRVFDEAAGDQPAPASDAEAASVVEPVPAPAPQPTPEPEENGGGKNKGKGRGTGNGQRKKNESEFWRNFKQGRRDVVGRKPDYGYRLGKVVGWLEEHPIWATIGAYGTYKGGKFLYDTFVGAPKSNEKDPNESDQTVNTSAVNGATTGTTGTVIYNPDQIPTDSTSIRPVAWP